MEQDKKSRKTSKEPKSNETKNYIVYNEIRPGIIKDINEKFNTETIIAFEKSSEETISSLIEEFTVDTTIPTDLDLLYNFNANINVCLSKWIKRHDKYSKGLSKNERKLQALEALITNKYKRDPDIHKGLLLNDKEIKNLITVNDDHIELEEKINNIKAIMSVIEMAISRLKDMSYAIRNALDALKIKNMIFNGNF